MSVETSGGRQSLRGCDICHERFRISGKMCRCFSMDSVHACALYSYRLYEAYWKCELHPSTSGLTSRTTMPMCLMEIYFRPIRQFYFELNGSIHTSVTFPNRLKMWSKMRSCFQTFDQIYFIFIMIYRKIMSKWACVHLISKARSANAFSAPLSILRINIHRWSSLVKNVFVKRA